MYIFTKTKIFEWLEEKKVKGRLYTNAHFQEVDRALLKAYKGQNPYCISIRYLKDQNAPDCYTYGETPLTTMASIVTAFDIRENDRVIEMGSGRGRAALYLAEYVGCRVRAYELIPVFIEKMACVKAPNLEMLAEDMFLADFSWATTIFLYGTLLSDEEIEYLAKRFPKNCKIITVSYSLSEYSESYTTRKTIWGLFPWGKTEIYLNERTC